MAPNKQHGDGAKPVYLVALPVKEKLAYSVLKIDAADVADGDEPRRARVVAKLPGFDRGMSFVAVHSRHGSWIVGVGGELIGQTIIFDPSTLETHQGPSLFYPKIKPVLISHGGKVYALSRRPRVRPFIDFDPWFESFNFNNGASRVEHKILRPPPFFPVCVDPFEFRYPREIEVSSYAAVGSFILFSPQPELAVGTYGFHVVSQRWEKVHDKNLPFVGEAVPLGGSLFAAHTISSNGIKVSASVFHMFIKSSEDSTSSLSISEVKVVASVGKIPLPLICPLGKGSFCSIKLGTRRHSTNFLKVKVIQTAFQMENTACHSLDAEAKELLVTVAKAESHTYKAHGRLLLVEPENPVVAALSMDTENIEPFEEETKASQVNEKNIFEARVYGSGT